MPAHADDLDLAGLDLIRGEGRRLELDVTPGDFDLGGEPYAIAPAKVPTRLDVSRTSSGGYALRLQFEVALEGRCMRCLEPASLPLVLDVREVDQPGAGEELSSPYVDDDDQLDLRGWARDSLALALPAQVRCRPDCAGLCPVCGEDLNANPHEHEREPDPRWAKLRELRLD